MSGSAPASKTFVPIILLVIGVALLGLGAFYFTTNTSFLADDFGRHVTHGAASTVVGIALIIAGAISWRRSKRMVTTRK